MTMAEPLANIVCPSCGKIHDEKRYYKLETIRGGGAAVIGCSWCGRDFTVREHVVRTYTTKKGRHCAL